MIRWNRFRASNVVDSKILIWPCNMTVICGSFHHCLDSKNSVFYMFWILRSSIELFSTFFYQWQNDDKTVSDISKVVFQNEFGHRKYRTISIAYPSYIWLSYKNELKWINIRSRKIGNYFYNLTQNKLKFVIFRHIVFVSVEM